MPIGAVRRGAARRFMSAVRRGATEGIFIYSPLIFVPFPSPRLLGAFLVVTRGMLCSGASAVIAGRNSSQDGNRILAIFI